jgi:cadmium resistance transport/sequestration family protein
MSGFIAAITTGVTAFVATNIDDILILTLFFSQVNAILRHRHIVIGQYLGFSLLLLASLLGCFGSYILPPSSIRLLGLIPIAIGLGSLLRLKEAESHSIEIEQQKANTSPLAHWLSPQTYGVAAVTVANGSDNISVYVPLFANNQLENLLVILGVFFTLVGVWCYAAYRLIDLPAIANLLTGYGSSFVPCVLIGLGVFIVKESFVLAGIAIAASCLWSITMSKDDERSTEIN